MRLQNLSVINYRNYQSQTIDFSPGKNLFLIIGQNAQGKTNILEAIYLLALCKSFRPIDFNGLMKWEEDYFEVKGAIKQNNQSKELTIIHQINPKNKKAHKVNGVKKSVTDFVGNLFVTFFSPDDLNLIFMSPAIRRKYLDVVLSQISRTYLQNLLKLKKVLQNRNQILKRIQLKKAQTDELDFWDEKLAEIGAQIVRERVKMIEFYNQRLTGYYSQIADQKLSLDLYYKSNMRGLSDSEILEHLGARLERDIREECTSLGPHRDDFWFYLNQKEMQYYCSRGEIRSAILALKMTEIDFFKEKTGLKPILLLDDAFSELDGKRKQFLLGLILNHQTIVTTTPENQNIFEKIKDSVVWYCEGGRINGSE
jgi:DNA replication and repair protein RecF